MLDLSVIILTKNEQLHIKRCLDNVNKIAKDIFIIDSFSTDQTIEISKTYPNVHVFQHKWENNHAKQFNWGLANVPISTKWILRLDADEYLTPELIDELKEKLPYLSDDITGIILKRRHIFMNKWMKNGIYPVKLLRIFKNGKGICEQRLMDEHIQLREGTTIEMNYDFCDHNLNNLSWFCHKHVDYAVREAADLIDIEIGLTGTTNNDSTLKLTNQAKLKREKKLKYAKQPLFWRSFIYFLYRYLLRGAWREGKEGFIFTFIQGWWYRTLVDAKVYEIKKICGKDNIKIRKYLTDTYNISLDF